MQKSTVIANMDTVKAVCWDDIVELARNHDVQANDIVATILSMNLALENVEGANELGK